MKQIDPAAVYPLAQLAALREKYTEEQIQLFANTFTGWNEVHDPSDDISSRWAYEWPGQDDGDDDDVEDDEGDV